MVGNNSNRWTPEQLTLMHALRADRVPWAEIALEVEHPIASCRQMMTHENNARRREAAKATNASLRETADRRAKLPPPPPIPRPSSLPLRKHPTARPDDGYARSSISTARLVMDAELRARIEVLGATGGLLGDPMPGRSALDRRDT